MNLDAALLMQTEGSFASVLGNEFVWVVKFLFHSLFLDLKTNKQSPPLIYRLPWKQLWFCILGQGRGREPHTAGKCGVRKDTGCDPPCSLVARKHHSTPQAAPAGRVEGKG